MRPDTVAERYLQVLESIRKIAVSSGRNPSDIQLVAVSKNVPVDRILEAYLAGCHDFGESRVQESLAKISMLPADINLHLIGTLQKNKANQAIGHYALIHSIDSLELAEKLSATSLKRDMQTKILIQVNTSGEQTKHGLSPEEWKPHLEQLLQLKGVRIEGLMTIAPLTSDEKVIRKAFSKLRQMREMWNSETNDPTLFKHLSMGMSSDYPIAIQEGATLLRIGTAIFGPR